MPKVPQISGAEAVKAFGKAGFERIRQRGSHVTLKKQGFFKIITVPLHNPVDRWLLASLIKDAQLTVDEFIDLL